LWPNRLGKAMQAVKIVGIVALIIWMAWISKELMDTKSIATEACGLAVSKMGPDGGFHLPVVCPDLDRGEIKL
jgi:hypothetical protein